MATAKTKEKKAKAAPAAKTGKLALAREAAAKILGGDSWRVTLDPEQLRESLPHISTGAMTVDYLIGGEPNRYGVAPCPGIPRKRVSQLWGHKAAGKTTLALHTAAAVCRAGGSVLYVDWENDIVLDYAEALGVPIGSPELFELVQPDTLEDGMKLIKTYALAGVDLIVIDSVGAAVPKHIAERGIEDTGEQARVGLAAQRWAEFLPDLKAVINKSNTAVLGISQIRAKIGAVGNAPKSEPQGGYAWKFYSSLRIELQKIKTEQTKQTNRITNKVEERVSGGIIKCKIVKCKLSRSQGREELFYIRQGEGIDDYRVTLEIAIAHGVIKKQGAWYAYEEQKWNGMEAMRTHFRETPAAFAQLVSAIRPFLTHKSTEGPEADVDDPDDLSEYVQDQQVEAETP